MASDSSGLNSTLIARLLGVIAFLLSLLVGGFGYFANRTFDEIDQLKANQAKSQENQVIQMERLGVHRELIDEAKASIKDIRDDIKERNP